MSRRTAFGVQIGPAFFCVHDSLLSILELVHTCKHVETVVDLSSNRIVHSNYNFYIDPNSPLTYLPFNTNRVEEPKRCKLSDLKMWMHKNDAKMKNLSRYGIGTKTKMGVLAVYSSDVSDVMRKLLDPRLVPDLQEVVNLDTHKVIVTKEDSYSTDHDHPEHFTIYKAADNLNLYRDISEWI